MFTDMESSSVPGGITRQARKAATRARLLAAAERALARSGLDGLTVGAIAREAEVAHGTVYVHFDSKEAVVDALLADLDAELKRRLTPMLSAFGAPRPPVEHRVLLPVALEFLDLLVERRSLVEAWVRRVAATAALPAAMDGVSPAASALLSSALATAGELLVDDELAVHAILAMWLRIGLRHALGGGPGRRDAALALSLLTAGALSAVIKDGRDA